ncbi:hypothetical protein GJAV_G00018930 [Gymnothorax javanicus]|nr:hypothetical protein GJAV_G00018930 [Gymnothorax javanicus]
MEETHKQACMFLELRQRLQSGLLVLRSDFAGNPSEVSVSGGDSLLQIKVPTGILSVDLPPGVALTEGSCRQVSNTETESLHFRLRLQVNQHIEAPESVLKRLKVKKSYSFCCQRCRERVLTERVFQRVLPLPNVNWSMVVEEWCCHPDPFANRKLLPRPGDCLHGDTYILLLRDSESGKTLKQEPSLDHTDAGHNQDFAPKLSRVNWTLCNACGAVLGEAIATETLKLYITELMVIENNEDGQECICKDRWLFLEQTVAARLVELSSTLSIFRFSLQTPNGKAFILLWLLNTDSLVASLTLPTDSGDASVSPGDKVTGRIEHLSSGASSAVKVLYLPCSPSLHNDITNAWEKDVSVHPLILPPNTCQEMLQILTSNTSTLPPSLREMNSFQVAFMRL